MEDTDSPTSVPSVNASDISPRDQPKSSPIGFTNTESTGPYIGTCAMRTTIDVPTMPQP